MIDCKTFDDIDIGDTASIERVLTKQDINNFAILSGDTNPTHFSDEYARLLLKKERLVGHNMWGGMLISAVLGNKLPGPGTVYVSQDLNFHTAVELGDKLTITVTVKEKLRKESCLIMNCHVVNQNGDDVITGDAKVKVPLDAPKEISEIDLEINIKNTNCFNDLLAKIESMKPVPTVVCYPCSEDALQGAIDAAKENLIEPIIVGPKKKLLDIAKTIKIDLGPYRVVDAESIHESVAEAVSLCNNHDAQILMKGSLHTDELMSGVVSRQSGLRTDRRISQVFLVDVPTYPRFLCITDAGINIEPTLDDKVHILRNAIGLMQSLGVAVPKVAILSAVEVINPKIPSTIEAGAICKMADRGQIKGAIIDGPLAFDNAISEEAARIKKIESPVAGKADIFLVPDLETGNMLGKQLDYLANGESASIVMGAKVPIILNSRADSARKRLVSCAIAVTYADWQSKQ